MCDQEKNTCENCLSDILEVIIKLQRRGQKFDDIKEGCDKPFLGPCPSICTTEPYVATNQFFTINLNCVGALECLADTYVDVCS